MKQLLTVIVIVVAGIVVYSMTQSSGPSVAPAPSSASSETQAPVTVAPSGSVVAYDQIKLKDGGGVMIGKDGNFGGQFASHEKYMKMFDAPHVELAQQIVTVNGAEGDVTFVRFADASQASAALQRFQAYARTSQPKKAGAAYGAFVVVMHARDEGSLDAFARAVQAQLAANGR